MDIVQFQPDNSTATTRLTITTTSGAMTLPVMPTGNNYNVLIYNAGAAIAYVGFVSSAAGTVVVPVSGGAVGATPIASGAYITINAPTRYLAGITSTGTADLYVTVGQGS